MLLKYAGREWRVRAEWLLEPWRVGRGRGGEGRARSDTARGGRAQGHRGRSVPAQKPFGGPRLRLRCSCARPRTPGIASPTGPRSGRVAVPDRCPRKKAHTLTLPQIRTSTGSAPEGQLPGCRPRLGPSSGPKPYTLPKVKGKTSPTPSHTPQAGRSEE